MELPVELRLVILAGLQESIVSGSDAQASQARDALLTLDYPHTAETAWTIRTRRLAAA